MGINYKSAGSLLVSDTSAMILDDNQVRKVLFIQNQDQNNFVHYAFDEEASIDTESIPPGGNLFITNQAPSGCIYVVSEPGETTKIIFREA